jgi:hypothetical protein
MKLFEFPTTITSGFTANVSDTLADPGLLAFLVAAIAIPLVFYVSRTLIGLIPKGRSLVEDAEDIENRIRSTEKKIKSEEKFLNQASNFTKEFGKLGD